MLATFASNVSRIQQAIDAAVMFNRKGCRYGPQYGKCYRNRSRTRLLEHSTKYNYRHRSVLLYYTMSQIMILTTGSQR